ncbi:uncharacterized protein BDV14DRAFT_189365 [Aspergillus stella-maris]|uniref:uncharacterized protein n=1 Tax=Aspergillus stella-maris TaxID=1810926 RepID=UPI003CCE2B1E
MEGLPASSIRTFYTVCDYPVIVTSDFLFGMLVAGIIVSSISVTLRIGARLMGSRLGLDDGAIVLSLVFALASSAVSFEAIRLGLGKDMWLVPYDNITAIELIIWLQENFYVVSIALSKIAMLLLYLRLFPHETFRLVTKITIIITAAWGLAFTLANIFSCRPINYYWAQWDTETEGYCTNSLMLFWIHAVTDIVLDMVILVIPLPRLLKLSFSWPKKLGIISMFTMGVIVTAVIIVRFIILIGTDVTKNRTKTFISLAVWTYLEIYLSIAIGCMPGVRAFFRCICARFPQKILVGLRHSTSTINLPMTPRWPETFQSTNPAQAEFLRLEEYRAKTYRSDPLYTLSH